MRYTSRPAVTINPIACSSVIDYSSLSHAATYATATAKNRIVIASINKSSIPPPYQAPRLFPHHQIMPMVAVS